MPRKPIDYSKTVVYKLCCKDPSVELIYVGSTTNWTKRKNMHKFSCTNPNNKKYNVKVYQIIRENGGWENFEMIMLEKYPCNDKIESDARERYWLEKLSAILNCVVPGRTGKEYRETHKEKIKEYQKEYRKEKYTCGCGSNPTKSHKSRHETSENHQHWLKTGEQPKTKGEKYTCGCGTTLTKVKKNRHETSQKHKKWLESSEK
jgi:hypothetical protein